MKNAYICDPRDEDDQPVDFQCIVCEDDPVDANNNCVSAATAETLSYSYMGAPNILACDHLTAPNCVGWDPGAAVTEYSSTDFDVDADFVDDLIADPSQLTECDGARVEPFGGFYQVTGASDGDLLHAVGLRNGDVIRSVNGHAMTGPFAAIRAFYELWPRTGSTSILISADRRGAGDVAITLEIE
jgi:hypothetical protein